MRRCSGSGDVDAVELVEVAVESGAAPGGGAAGGAEPERAELGGAEPERAEPRGAELERAEPGGAGPERVDSGGVLSLVEFLQVPRLGGSLSLHRSCASGFLADGDSSEELIELRGLPLEPMELVLLELLELEVLMELEMLEVLLVLELP
ncbi:unnamed protein product [Closterium sp. NIES-65]|nr:unnamed protein product [Closterium sp. NIES-65]